MKYFKRLEGENVYLSPINVDDYQIYTKWLNNYNIVKYLTMQNQLLSLNKEKEIMEKISNEEFVFAIVKSDKDVLIGNVGLSNIDYKNGNAELGIFIGEEGELSKGYGSEAILLLINYAFNNLRLHNIMLTVYADNIRAIKCYNKCGFKEFGRRTDALFRDGKYIDLIYMEIVNK